MRHNCRGMKLSPEHASAQCTLIWFCHCAHAVSNPSLSLSLLFSPGMYLFPFYSPAADAKMDSVLETVGKKKEKKERDIPSADRKEGLSLSKQFL